MGSGYMNIEVNKALHRTSHKVRRPVNADVQRPENMNFYGEIATATATEEKYGKKSALCREK